MRLDLLQVLLNFPFSLLLYSSLLLLCSAADDGEPLRVAVVGAGIGGSTFSHFIKELLPGSHVEVFEASGRVGGRAEHIDYLNKTTLEIGASIIYSGNKYLHDLTEKMGLTRIPPRHSEGSMGLWDGSSFALWTGGGMWRDAANMLWRYGYSLLRLKRLVNDSLDKFVHIYPMQEEQQRAFTDPADLWAALGLLDLTQTRTDTYLNAALGRNDTRVLKELVYAVNRVNYNQDNGLNALAGMISLCPAVTGDLFQVKEGNAQLAVELLRAANATVHHHSKVTRIVGGSISSSQLGGAATKPSYILLSGQEELGRFDAVAVAAPLQLLGISFDIRAGEQHHPGVDGRATPGGGGASAVKDGPPVIPPRPFQTTITTFVKGRVNASYFLGEAGGAGGAGEEALLPPSVLLTEGGGEQETWSSLALHLRLEDDAAGDDHDNNEQGGTKGAGAHAASSSGSSSGGGDGGAGRGGFVGVYKLFSGAKLPSGMLDRLFAPGSWEVLLERDWKAYPLLHPGNFPEGNEGPRGGPLGGQAFAKTELFVGHPIYYLNAMEDAVSAMEISAIAAKNAALLMHQHFTSNRGQAEEEGAGGETEEEEHEGASGSEVEEGDGGGGATLHKSEAGEL